MYPYRATLYQRTNGALMWHSTSTSSNACAVAAVYNDTDDQCASRCGFRCRAWFLVWITFSTRPNESENDDRARRVCRCFVRCRLLALYISPNHTVLLLDPGFVCGVRMCSVSIPIRFQPTQRHTQTPLSFVYQPSTVPSTLRLTGRQIQTHTHRYTRAETRAACLASVCRHAYACA